MFYLLLCLFSLSIDTVWVMNSFTNWNFFLQSKVKFLPKVWGVIRHLQFLLGIPKICECLFFKWGRCSSDCFYNNLVFVVCWKNCLRVCSYFSCFYLVMLSTLRMCLYPGKYCIGVFYQIAFGMCMCICLCLWKEYVELVCLSDCIWYVHLNCI